MNREFIRGTKDIISGAPAYTRPEICSVCGKEFYASGEWVYRATERTIQCSYTCFRAIQKKSKPKKPVIIEEEEEVVRPYAGLPKPRPRRR